MIGYYYPEAVRQLNAAKQSKLEMAALWKKFLDDGGVDTFVHVDGDGSGRVYARIYWDERLRVQLTELFSRCVNALWASLDSLIAESVELFRHLRHSVADQPKFFPVAPTVEGLDELLETGCADGILEKHCLLIRACQPFTAIHEIPQVARMQRSVRRLLEWENALADGHLVGAWVTPTTATIFPPAGSHLVELTDESAGEIGTIQDVATFSLAGYRLGKPVEAQSNAYVDLGFAHGFNPETPDDTFEERLLETMNGVAMIVAVFAREASAIETVSVPQTPGSEPLWVDAVESSRWARKELELLRRAESGIGVVEGRDEFTLIVNTREGIFERVIPQATPLRAHERKGIAAENAVQDAAATWGLPDFVFKPVVEQKGSGVREIGDGILVAGPIGAIVQTKAREATPVDDTRERQWITKKTVGAARQVFGTSRRLNERPLSGHNGRGQAVTIHPGVHWVGVVVIDHPAPPSDVLIPPLEGPIPVVALLRRDWEFLFNQLRSTDAVLRYLHRVGHSAENLGDEPARYFELARKDEITASEPNDRPVPAGAFRPELPLLPLAPAGSDDPTAFGLVRVMLEDVATSNRDSERTTELRDVLAAIDRTPVTYRVALGRFLLDHLAATKDGQSQWRIRRFLDRADTDQIAFAVCPEITDFTRYKWQAWTLLRQHERGEAEPLTGRRLVAVLLTPRHDGVRQWDTTMSMIEGDPGLSAEEVEEYMALWPPVPVAAGVNG